MTANVSSALAQARALGQSGDYKGVINSLGPALRDEPDNLDALFLMGAASFKLNLFDRAREAWARILDIDPRHDKALKWMEKLKAGEVAYHLDRARGLGQAGDYKAVIRSCNDLLANHPEHIEALFLLGAACFKLGVFGRARDCWIRVLAIDPSFNKAQRWLDKLPKEEGVDLPAMAGGAAGLGDTASFQAGPPSFARNVAPSEPTRSGDRIEIRHKETGEVLRSLKAESLENADLAGVDLQYAQLAKAKLNRANLYASDLSRANLADANMTDANMRSAILTEANLAGSTLRQSNLVHAFLRGATLADANMADADLTRAVLNNSNLHGANLHDASLMDADLQSAVLTDANLSGANLEGANLASAYLRAANLAGANLAGADLARVNLANANLEGANLEGARLSGAFLRAANLTNANLAGTDLTRANMSSVNLEGANLSQSNLTDADLGGALLIDADLSGAIVDGVDLGDADLTRANLDRTGMAVADSKPGGAPAKSAVRKGSSSSQFVPRTRRGAQRGAKSQAEASPDAASSEAPTTEMSLEDIEAQSRRVRESSAGHGPNDTPVENNGAAPLRPALAHGAEATGG